MFEVFDVLQANRAKTLDSRVAIKISQTHRQYKSAPNVAVSNNSAGDAPETWWPSTTEIMRRCKSMPNMSVRSNSADNIPDIGLPFDASTERQVSIDSPSTELSVTAPGTTEVGEIEAPSNASSSLPHVWPVEDVVLQSSPMCSMEALQFDNAETKNCLTKPLVHQEISIQDMVVTRGGRSDTDTNSTVPAVIPKRRSLWSRTKRFVRRMICCCGAKSA
ncbi:uncharacterized protein LOC132952812 [Metopolophium dirhodum]|uniref:uncharacterized protein LOC132952812 n=1 Tax=Metopolophium dirhodum TaxID=44670 RepID=UPI00298F493A|nr:uncharacterized protein LOC132952812 [Metopolophium dirhodum]XP_060881234.1 uncharacterized protein LOC132952812 [Metopolophium dirhodum]